MNIVVVKDNDIIRLELFDFGTSSVNSKNFEHFFKEDLKQLSIIAFEFLCKKDFLHFSKKITQLKNNE